MDAITRNGAGHGITYAWHSKKNGGFGWWLNSVSSACATYGWLPDVVIHDIPLVQIFALNACHAWGQGLEVSGETYEDRHMNEALAQIVAAKSLTTAE